jgi:flavin reductase (DIM6/NTAB) family NADH-FMN oxidoreductase RutF
MMFLLLVFVVAKAEWRRRTTTTAFAVPASREKLIPPPPPISMPVWSLATPSIEADKGSPRTSMNVVTFATAVSVAIPKLWVVSLYYDTLTKDSFCEKGTGVLQLLRPSQKVLVPVLGKRSGYEQDFDKKEECSKLGFNWIRSSWIAGKEGLVDLLPDCACYIALRLKETMPAGDHLVALCEVIETGQWDPNEEEVIPRGDSSALRLDPSTVLYTAELREEGII